MRPRRRLGLGAIAAACVAGAVAVGGCGGGSVNDPVAQAAVAKAATVSNQAPGMRMLFSMQIRSPALPGPITFTGGGTSDSIAHTGSFNMVIDFGSIPQAVDEFGTSTVQVDDIVDGQTVYIKTVPSSVAQSMGLGGGKPWAKTNLVGVAAATGTSPSSLTGNAAWSDPNEYLTFLRAASGGVTKVGSEAVDGVQTTKYRALIELDRVLATVAPASRAQVRKAISSFEKLGQGDVLPMDIWIDGRHLVRRMAFTINGSITGHSVALALQIDFPRYGRQPAPQLPPAGFGGSSSPKAQVRQAYIQVQDAIVSGNAKRVCSLITKHAVQELARQGKLGPGASCAAAVQAVFTAGVRAKDKHVQIVSITIRGNRASLLDSTGSPPGTFIKQRGSWVVYSFV